MSKKKLAKLSARLERVTADHDRLKVMHANAIDALTKIKSDLAGASSLHGYAAEQLARADEAMRVWLETPYQDYKIGERS